MHQSLCHHFAIVAVACVVFFTNLGIPKLWDRDEPRNAGCAVEMLQREGWVTPYFNGELRTHKPVLLYWLMMSAYWAFGVNEFGARFWSAALGVGTVVTTYHIGRRLFNAQVGLWAGVILASSLMFDVAARAATPDSILIFLVTLSLLVYVYGAFGQRETDGDKLDKHENENLFPRQWTVVATMYAVMGLAILAKGPVGFVLPTAVIGMFLLIKRLPLVSGGQAQSRRSAGQWCLWIFRPFAPQHFLQTCWAMRPMTALALSLAVALPWYLWVGIKTDGEWVKGFLWEHNFGRATQTMEGHGGSLLYYPVAILIGFLPWSVFAVPTVIGMVRRLQRSDPWKNGYLLLACWVGVYVGAFTIAETKLPSYVTPCYPALALLTGCFLYHWIQGVTLSAPIWLSICLAVFALSGVVGGIAISIAAHFYLPGEQWLGILGLLPAVSAVACYWLILKGKRQPSVVVFALSAVVLMTAIFGYASVRVDRHQNVDQLIAEIKDGDETAEFHAFASLEPSWVFYHGKPIPLIQTHEAKTAHQYLEGGRNRYLITPRESFETFRDQLHPEATVLASTPYFLHAGEIVIVGRSFKRPRMSHREVLGNTTDH